MYCGVSDIADGLVARALKQQSELGAKLDSIADMVLIFVIAIVVVPVLLVPSWIWVGAIAITLIRVTGYLIGFKKYHKFSALHTYANKITGGILFCTPILYALIGITASGVILCLFAVLSAFEELLITVISKDLDSNCKSIFVR